MRTLAVALVACVLVSWAQAEELTGVVVDSEGHPAEGAKVSAAAIFHSPPLRQTTHTDAHGAFRLDLPRLSGSERYAIAVRWQQQGADLTEARDAQGEMVGLSGQALPTVAIQLRPAGALRGKLLRAEDDGPIADARLFLDTGEVLTTDAHGQFELLGLPMKAHELIPVAPGRVRDYVLFDTSLEPDARLEVRLARGAILKGRIVDEAGRPVVGAYLQRASSGTALTLNGWDQEASEGGKYEYGGLSTQRLFYSLTASAPGYESAAVASDVDDPTAVIARDIVLHKKSSLPAEAPVGDTEAEDDKPVELPRRTLHGTVTDTEDRPITDAEIRWGSFQWDDSLTKAKTDAEGHYRLAGVPGGRGALFVIAEGYAPEFAPAQESDEKIDVQLTRGGTVRGRVTNRSGKPVAGVWVVAQIRCAETGYCNPIYLSKRSTTTDDDGAFEVAAVPKFGVTFDFLKDGYSDKRNVPLRADGKVHTIELTTGGAVQGRVVDATGQPVRDFKVRVMIPRKRDQSETVGGYYAGFDWYGVRFTRDDGEFVLSGVPAGGLMRLIVSSPTQGVGIVDRAPTAPLDELPPVDELTIRLEPYQALDVKVIAVGSGQPVSDALVSLLPDEPDFSHGFSWGYHDLWGERRRTDASGQARFDRPACTDGTILVRAPGFARARPSWNGSNREMQILLEPAAEVHGDVRLSGALLREGLVRLRSADGDALSVDLSETGGTFEFPELPAGEWSLAVTNGANQTLHAEQLTLDAGETQERRIAASVD